MLILTRKLGESILIDENIRIKVVQIKGKQVRLGIEAPNHMRIFREELTLNSSDSALNGGSQESLSQDSGVELESLITGSDG